MLVMSIIKMMITYRIVGYLHGVQILRMSSIQDEPVIFTDVLLTT